MINDIKNSKVNMVVTKDLSRLGRDYIETGEYIEKWFPEHGIRYVSVTDGIDTFETSIQPYEDCCTVFTPKHPKTKPKVQDVIDAENKIPNLDEMMKKAMETAKRVFIK